MSTSASSAVHAQVVESSLIAAVAYHPGAGVLDVQLKNGSRYRYFNVPAGIYDAWLGADSMGRFFNAPIKGAFRYQRF